MIWMDQKTTSPGMCTQMLRTLLCCPITKCLFEYMLCMNPCIRDEKIGWLNRTSRSPATKCIYAALEQCKDRLGISSVTAESSRKICWVNLKLNTALRQMHHEQKVLSSCG